MGKDAKDGLLWSTTVIPAKAGIHGGGRHSREPTSFPRPRESRGAGGDHSHLLPSWAS